MHLNWRTSATRIHIISPVTASRYFRHSSDWSIERSHHSLILRNFIVERTTERARAPSVLIAVISLEFIHPAEGRKASRGVVFVIGRRSSTSLVVLDPPRVALPTWFDKGNLVVRNLKNLKLRSFNFFIEFSWITKQYCWITFIRKGQQSEIK